MKTIIAESDGTIIEFIDGQSQFDKLNNGRKFYTSETATGTETNISEVTDAVEQLTLKDLWLNIESEMDSAGLPMALKLSWRKFMKALVGSVLE